MSVASLCPPSRGESVPFPLSRAPPTPEPSPNRLPNDLIAFMHFMVDELQQEPRDIPQDKGADQVPVNHIPKTANAPAGGPGQGSARIRSQLRPSLRRPGRDSLA